MSNFANFLHELKLPAPGQLYEEEGGYFAGLLALPHGLYGLIVPPRGAFKMGDCTWGEYGQKVEGTDSLIDGKANTAALLALPPEKAPAAHAARGCQHAGRADWYLGSQKENMLAWVHCQEQIEKKFYWSSTQFSASSAWAQDFHDGYTDFNGKGNSFSVLPVRRFKILDL